jgi:hypothetical protein
VRAGIKSVDEVRQELGLAPVGKGAAEVAKYNPNQPRVPAGSPKGGRFGLGDGASSAPPGIELTRPKEMQVAQADNVGTVTDATGDQLAEAKPATVGFTLP